MKKNVRFTQNGIYLEGSQSEKEGKEIPLYSGSIHYWRMDPETWETALINAKNMGFSIVETYIPWGYMSRREMSLIMGKKTREKI
ncbi:MAG: beta-galactosidase [Ruminococcus sp.]